VAKWSVLSVGLAIVLAAGWWVTNSPAFDMRSITVRGNEHLTVGEVQRSSGLTARSNVLWLKTGPLERRLEANPWVLAARISRHPPSGIAITIEERVAVAVTGGRHPMLLSGDGMVLGAAAEGARLPVVATNGTPPPGHRVEASGELAVARSLPPRLLPEVKRVGRTAAGSLVVIMREGIKVLYGTRDAAVAKSQALQAVLSWAARHGVRPALVDVRSPAAPALRLQP
jgi:cell division protein FtsQ